MVLCGLGDDPFGVKRPIYFQVRTVQFQGRVKKPHLFEDTWKTAVAVNFHQLETPKKPALSELPIKKW